MATVVGKATLDSWIANNGGNFGNGAGPRLQVGYSAAFGSSRVLLAIPLTGSGGALGGVTKAITQAVLGLRVRGANGCTNPDNNPRFWVEELASLITENSENTECTVTSAGASTGRWPGATASTTNRVKYDSGKPAVDSWVSIDITAMVEAARQAGKAVLYLRLIAADSGSGYDETSNGRVIAFYSRNTVGSEPKLTVTHTPNTAPSAPTVSPAGGPAGGTPVVTNPGTSLAVTVTPNDADVGDSMTGAKMEVYPDGTTQAQIDAGTAPTPITVSWTQTASPFPTSKVLTATGLTGNTKYLYRCQTRDKGNGSADQSAWTWGAWTALQYVQTNTVPSTIGNLNVESDSLTPAITGLLSDADPGATINRVRLIVERPNGDGSYTTMLDAWFTGAGITGGTAFTATYNGSPLTWGTQYRINGQIEDNLAQAGALLSSPIYWTPTQVLGPDNMSPRSTASKVNTRSPTLTIAHSSAFDQYELEVANAVDGGGGLAWDKGITSIASTTSAAIAWGGASPLPWAARPSWRAKVRITATSNWTDWSPWFPFAVNAMPETGTFYVKDQSGAWVLLSTLSAKVAASVTPDIYFGWAATVPGGSTPLDPDYASYGELPKWRDIEVRTDADVLRARLIRRMYAAEDATRIGPLWPIYKPGSLTPGNSGFTPGTATVLGWFNTPTPPVGTHSLKVALSNLATATETITTGPPTVLGSLYTDLSGATTCRVRLRATALPTGQIIRLRFLFSGNDANYAQFDLTMSAANTWEQKTLTLASPTSTGGVVNWAQVHRIDLRVVQTSGSNQSWDIYLNDFSVDLYAVGSTYKLKGRFADQNTEDAWGAQSHADQYALLKTSTPPVVAQSGSISTSDPTPDIAWTVTGDQAKRRVLIEELPGYRDVIRYMSGCAGYWRFGETTGTTAVDLIAGRNGTYTGGYTLNQTGMLGAVDPDPAVLLNGTTGYVTVPYNAALHPGNVFTIFASIKRTAAGTLRTIWSAGANDVEVDIEAGNTIAVFVQGGAVVWRSVETLTDTTNWHRLIVIRPGTRLMRVFLDGVLLTAAVLDTTLAFTAHATSALNFGRRVGTADQYLSAAIDEFALFNRALSDTEALAVDAARLRDPAAVTVHDSLVATTAALTYKVPPGILQNVRTYRPTVEVTNADGLVGSVVM